MNASPAGPVLIGADRLDRRRRRHLPQSLRHGPVVPEHRLWVVHDTSGPRVRLGIAWGGLSVAAIALGPLPAAMLFAVVAGTAATQTAAALRHDAQRAHGLLAGVVALAMALVAAGPTSRLVGAVVLAGVVASLFSTGSGLALDPAGATIRAWLPSGSAAASVVLLTVVDRQVTLVLLALACTYDAGDYLIGSASRHPLEGPLAGGVGVLVVTFGLAVLQPADLATDRLWLLGVLTAVGCPLGQLVASVTLPRARAFAPALRRLDTLILVGPLWLAVVG